VNDEVAYINEETWHECDCHAWEKAWVVVKLHGNLHGYCCSCSKFGIVNVVTSKDPHGQQQGTSVWSYKYRRTGLITELLCESCNEKLLHLQNIRGIHVLSLLVQGMLDTNKQRG